MSVTDGTSSRLLAGAFASNDRRTASPSEAGAFDRLKSLAATILRARRVVVLLDDDDTNDPSDAASPEFKAFARLARQRKGGLFVADAASQSWIGEPTLLMSLDPVGYGGVPLTLSEGLVVGCVCVEASEARGATFDVLSGIEN